MIIKKDVDTLDLTGFATKDKLRILLKLQSLDDLIYLKEFLVEQDLLHTTVQLIGGGYNCLFSGDYNGLVIQAQFRGRRIISQSFDEVDVEVASGEDWPSFVHWCLLQGLHGLENLTAIPGSVGAAPVQNIGAYGVEVANSIVLVRGFTLPDCQTRSYNREQCQFAYRQSIFKKQPGTFVITSVVFRLSKIYQPIITYHELERFFKGRENIEARQLVDFIECIRAQKLPDPKKLANCGCFFQNPELSMEHWTLLREKWPDIPGFVSAAGSVKISAAWMIEQCGWKGRRIGHCGVSSQHALVLVNYGQASGSDIKNLAMQIQNDVWQLFGVWLEPEVNIIENPE